MVPAASYPPLQKAQGRGTHSPGMGSRKQTLKGRATRPKPNCQDQPCVWNVPTCQYMPCFRALPPIPTSVQCLVTPGDAVPELPGVAPEQPDAPPGPPPPTGTESGQAKVDALGMIVGYFADAARCWVYKIKH
jgi:hypothetical protein